MSPGYDQHAEHSLGWIAVSLMLFALIAGLMLSTCGCGGVLRQTQPVMQAVEKVATRLEEKTLPVLEVAVERMGAAATNVAARVAVSTKHSEERHNWFMAKLNEVWPFITAILGGLALYVGGRWHKHKTLVDAGQRQGILFRRLDPETELERELVKSDVLASYVAKLAAQDKPAGTPPQSLNQPVNSVTVAP